MVFDKLREAFSGNDEKYEILYYNFSKLKAENIRLKNNHKSEFDKYKKDVERDVANYLITIYEEIGTAKASSFKIQAMDKDIQKLLVDLNRVEAKVKKIMGHFSVTEVNAEERFYDSQIHDIASYNDSGGMKSGLVLKTVKKGFKYGDIIIKKPKVIVTK